MFKTSSLHRYRFVTRKLLSVASVGASTFVSRPSSSQADQTPQLSIVNANNAAAAKTTAAAPSSGSYFQNLLDKITFYAGCFFLIAGFKFPLLWLANGLLFLFQFRNKVSYKTQAVSVLSVLLLGRSYFKALRLLLLLAGVLGALYLKYYYVTSPKPQQQSSNNDKVYKQ